MFVLEDLKNKNIELNNTNFMYFERSFLDELSNGFIQKIQTLDTESFYLKIKIRKEGKNKDLIVGSGICFISENKTETMKENKGFSAYLNKTLENKKIQNIKQINLEKILVFEFENYNLYFEFFSNNNIIFTDKENKILSQLLRESWKDRNIKKNETYFPPTNLKNIFEYIPNEMDLDFNKNIVSNIVKNINVHPKLLEKYFDIKKLDKDKINF
jgi:predicted ribosome quality control (RQC) complex YloA/Tae2 family protein